MVKKILVVVLILALCASCKRIGANRYSNELSDFAISEDSSSVFGYYRDTMRVMKDIAKCDSLIRLGKNKRRLFMLYQHKINLLSAIGKVKNAYYEQGKAMRLLPKADPRRFEYEAIGAYLQNDMDRYSQLLNQAIGICKRYPRNAVMTFDMATCYILLGDDNSSKAVMREFLKHDKDQGISAAYEDYSSYKKQVLDGRRMLMEALK